MSIPISASFDARRMSTEDLHRIHDAVGAVLAERDALGESSLRPDQFERLLARLGQCPQAAVLRMAAADDQGRVSREAVLELLQRPAGARLNGFRKPIDRAVAALVAEGDFPPVSPGPLYADYAGGVSLREFCVSPGDLPALRAALGA